MSEHSSDNNDAMDIDTQFDNAFPIDDDDDEDDDEDDMGRGVRGGAAETGACGLKGHEVGSPVLICDQNSPPPPTSTSHIAPPHVCVI